ncbi:hydroxyacylglutathione hydrolase [Paracoccaceae bacterium GXU_MW_L88]
MTEIVTIPCLSDNYAYLVIDELSTTLIDAPEAAPILKQLEARDLRLDQILLTHHHPDHIDGVAAILEEHPARVIGNEDDADRLPDLDRGVLPGDRLTLGSETVEVMDAPGHTIGHVAFYFPDAAALFSADSLMVMGCGRLFEGTAEQMLGTLNAFAALPGRTAVYSGHEYTATNCEFAQSIEPDNAALTARAAHVASLREKNEPTIPSTIDEEKTTNPFMRSNDPDLKAALGMENADDLAVFTELRSRRDKW